MNNSTKHSNLAIIIINLISINFSRYLYRKSLIEIISTTEKNKWSEEFTVIFYTPIIIFTRHRATLYIITIKITIEQPVIAFLITWETNLV